MQLKQVLIALDQLVNTLIGGWADETISSRAYRRHVDGRPGWANLINRIFYWQSNHCRGAYRDERERRQYPPEFRDSTG